MRKFLKYSGYAFGVLVFLSAVSFLCMVLRESKTIEEVAPEQGMFITTRDAKVFVREEGPAKGQKILLIHGTGAWGEIWRDTTDILVEKGFRVITVDVPPFGYSQKLIGSRSYNTGKQADRIHDVLTALKADKLYALCHSVGCRAMTEAVLKDPSKFSKFILVDPALGFSKNKNNPSFQQNSPGFLTRIMLAPSFVRTSIIAAYGSNPWSIKPIFSSFVFNKASVTHERLVTLKRPLAIEDMTRAQGDWLENLSVNEDHSMFTKFDAYNSLEMPVLLIWGDQDNITPLWQGQALVNFFKKAQLQVIKDTGHIPYLEKTDEFNEKLMGFLKDNR